MNLKRADKFLGKPIIAALLYLHFELNAISLLLDKKLSKFYASSGVPVYIFLVNYLAEKLNYLSSLGRPSWFSLHPVVRGIGTFDECLVFLSFNLRC